MPFLSLVVPEPTTTVTIGAAVGGAVVVAAMATCLSLLVSCLVMRNQNKKYSHSSEYLATTVYMYMHVPLNNYISNDII